MSTLVARFRRGDFAWGWRCLTCGAEETGLPSAASAHELADGHKGVGCAEEERQQAAPLVTPTQYEWYRHTTDCDRLLTENRRLREGIEALADEWEAVSRGDGRARWPKRDVMLAWSKAAAMLRALQGGDGRRD